MDLYATKRFAPVRCAENIIAASVCSPATVFHKSCYTLLPRTKTLVLLENVGTNLEFDDACYSNQINSDHSDKLRN